MKLKVAGACPYCSGPHSGVIHAGPCPKVKAIEYHPGRGRQASRVPPCWQELWPAHLRRCRVNVSSSTWDTTVKTPLAPAESEAA